eukprot:scaffold71265_cov50-Attheya_sp.AAC.4
MFHEHPSEICSSGLLHRNDDDKLCHIAHAVHQVVVACRVTNPARGPEIHGNNSKRGSKGPGELESGLS